MEHYSYYLLPPFPFAKPDKYNCHLVMYGLNKDRPFKHAATMRIYDASDAEL
jgi:hypothetical protein